MLADDTGHARYFALTKDKENAAGQEAGGSGSPRKDRTVPPAEETKPKAKEARPKSRHRKSRRQKAPGQRRR